MRKIANILWYFPFFGFIDGIVAFLLGTLLVLTVVGAPIGIGLIQWSKFLFAPFTNEMIDKKDLNVEQNKLWKSFGFIVRIVYFPIGLFIAFCLILQSIGLFLSVVGIPVGIVVLKSVTTAFNPVNKVCVPRAVANELERRKDEAIVQKHLG
jgi:uncharacterized membrane protein YccF (DUF307 family)